MYKHFSIPAAAVFTIMLLSASCEKVSKTSDENDDIIYTFDTTTVVQIMLNGTSITVEPEVADIDGSKVTLRAPGTYNIKGSLSDGQVVVNCDTDGLVRIILDSANIRCSDSAPIYIKDAEKVAVNLAAGTVNYLTDGTSYVTEDGEPDAALFSNSDLVIYGDGTLNVSASYLDGISSDDGLVIKSGTLSVTANDDGIRGKDYLIINDGDITVNSKGDGIKSTNDEDASLGYITIDKGTFNITATGGDGIEAVTNLNIADGTFAITTGGGASASTTTTGGGNPGGGPGGSGSGGYSGTVSEKALKAGESLSVGKGIFTINAADDGVHSNGSVNIDDGNFAVASGDDAIHADKSITINNGTINVTRCYEGFESALITISDGTVSLVSTDDGFNATMGSATEYDDGSHLYIKGGNIMVNSSNGDALDSNGSAEISCGSVILHGPQSSPEVAFDVNGSFIISGGFMVASGPNSGNMIETPAASSTVYSVKVTMSSTLSSSSLFHIEDADANDIVTFKPVRSAYYIVVASPDMQNGSSYSIYTGGSTTGTDSNGLYTGGVYSGGTLKKTFTISSKVTSVSF